MIVTFLIQAIIDYTIPIYCLMSGIYFYCLFNKNKKLKYLIIAIASFGLFILNGRL